MTTSTPKYSFSWLPPVSSDPYTILIADDDLTSLRTAVRPLQKAGYNVLVARDGHEAWELITGDPPPHVAVLDWMMPGHDGPELCRMLKKRKDLFVYTLLLTAKTGVDHLVEGLESGADDFLSKPFNLAELTSRIAAGVRIVAYEQQLSEKTDRLAQYAESMERLAEERARQLVHADRIATLGMLSAGIAHEINNPTAFISGNVQMLQRFWPYIEAALRRDPDQGDEALFIQEEIPKLLEEMTSGIRRISTIVSGLKRYARQERSDKAPTQLARCVEDAVQLCSSRLKTIRLERVIEDAPRIEASAQEITQVLVNLIVNAADALDKVSSGHIRIGLRQDGDRQTLTIDDNGSGIPKEHRQRIFDPFFTTKPPDRGTGLGLSISHGIIRNHDGEIRLETSPLGGARFVIELPQTHQEGHEPQ